MKAEIVAMTADAIDHAALARGGDVYFYSVEQNRS